MAQLHSWILVRNLRSNTLARKLEHHRNGGFNLHGLAVEQIWTITPLFDRIDRGRREHGMSAYQRQILDLTVLGNNCREDHGTRNPSRASDLRIGGLNPVNQHTLRHSLRDPYALWGGRNQLRHRIQIGSGADNPANHAPELSSGNPSRYSTNDASRCWQGRWCFFLFDHLHLLRNAAGCA